jgi:hypothetical protein
MAVVWSIFTRLVPRSINIWRGLFGDTGEKGGGVWLQVKGGQEEEDQLRRADISCLYLVNGNHVEEAERMRPPLPELLGIGSLNAFCEASQQRCCDKLACSKP